MATLGAIRNAIKSTIEDNISGLRVYETMPDDTTGHALLVEPTSVNFARAMQRGTDEWQFTMFVIIPWQETTVVQDELDIYLSGSGTKSIRQVIFNNRTLGSVVDDAFVPSMDGYGGSFAVAKIPHIGARLYLTVFTSGTS
jgi:hypothetical protein